MHPSSTDRPAFFSRLPRWLAIDQHASMPACHDQGVGISISISISIKSQKPKPRMHNA
jgi:hypothetical protein